MSTRDFAGVRRVIVKVGSGVLAGDGALSQEAVERLADDIHDIRLGGIEVTLVVSGAVAAGFVALGCLAPPREVVPRQAAASIGQPRLMAALAAAFARHDIDIAQLLLSAEDIENRRRFLSARHTLRLLLDRDIVPVINENDAVSDDEVKVGDNDHLAALATQLASADMLILLSQVDGVLRDGGAGPRIREVVGRASLKEHIGPNTSATGVGGMAAKISAADLASSYGVATVIADGRQPGTVAAVLRGDDVGTLFMPIDRKLSARKRWIGVRARSRGTLTIDAGAVEAVVERGASLLPTGVLTVTEEFSKGARVEIHDEDGRAFAVGLVSYAAREIRRIAGKKASEVEAELGYRYIDAVIEREDLVLFENQMEEVPCQN